MITGSSFFPRIVGSTLIALAIAPHALARRKNEPASNEPPYNTTSDKPLFNPFPDVTDRKPWLVRNFGPVGINLIRPGMTMHINNMEPGYPADKTSKPEARGGDGIDFLIIERGGFNVTPDAEESATAAVSKDWHRGFHVYVRRK